MGSKRTTHSSRAVPPQTAAKQTPCPRTGEAAYRGSDRRTLDLSNRETKRVSRVSQTERTEELRYVSNREVLRVFTRLELRG